MPPDLNSNGSYIRTSDTETVIHGPSGEIRVSKGIQSGQTLDDSLAQSIVDAGGGQFSIEDDNGEKYLLGPDGYRHKIGDPLNDDDIASLTKTVPDLVKGGTTMTGADGNKAGNNTPTPISGTN
jgi:hypothetical protein